MIADNKRVLFLDRDGVINIRNYQGYITSVNEFHFIDGVIESLIILKNYFSYIFIVTNQQGVGKRIMSEEDLIIINNYMTENINKEIKIIDKVYYCPHIAELNCTCRKPKIGMYEQAIADYPDIINMKKCMIGDTISDMKFARNSNMTSVLIGEQNNISENELSYIDIIVPSLYIFAKHCFDKSFKI